MLTFSFFRVSCKILFREKSACCCQAIRPGCSAEKGNSSGEAHRSMRSILNFFDAKKS